MKLEKNEALFLAALGLAFFAAFALLFTSTIGIRVAQEEAYNKGYGDACRDLYTKKVMEVNKNDKTDQR